MAPEIDQLRNIGLLGHRGSGKTSLGEAMLFVSGTTQRLGKVEDGTSVLDHEPEEVNRQVSISTAFHSLKWQKRQCTLVDTPGFANFLPEAIYCMKAFEGSIFMLNASSGIRVEAERLWQQARELQMPMIFFVNRMDREEENAPEAPRPRPMTTKDASSTRPRPTPAR